METTLQQFFKKHNNRAAIREDALIYYGANSALIQANLNKLGGSWEFYIETYHQVKYRFIYVDSMPKPFRLEYKIPDPEVILSDEGLKNVDPSEIQKRILFELKLFISTGFARSMREEDGDGPNFFIGFIERGFDSQTARLLARSKIMLLLCLRLVRSYSIENIYNALLLLIEEHKNSTAYEFVFNLKSLRTFYNQIGRAREGNIDEIIIHGLTGKPSNNRMTSMPTMLMIVELLKHFNHLSDQVVKIYANTIIIALPNLFNNGKTVSRATINNIKNGEYKNAILAARLGEEWIRENWTRDVNRVPTQFALDRVECDFTKLHAEVAGVNGEPVKKFICRFKDVKSGAILGDASGKSESFQLFLTAFRRFLVKTNYLLPAELVYDRSPAIVDNKEFIRIKTFIEHLELHMTEAHSPTAKGSIESHFATLLATFLPQHIGSLGGNVRTTDKHRPKREIRLILQRPEYMQDEDEWEKILRDINRRYNASPTQAKKLGPLEDFLNDPKPNAMRLEQKYIAYLSWHPTQILFSQQTFILHYANKTYKFGKELRVINSSKQDQEFVLKRTGDRFDVFFNPDDTSRIYVFEQGKAQFVDEFPLLEWVYGNKVDQAADPARLKALMRILNDRRKFTQTAKAFVREISRVVKDHLGMDLHKLLKEIHADSSKKFKEEELLDEIFKLISGKTAQPLDPFSIDVPRKSSARLGRAPISKPIKVNHKTDGKETSK